MTMKIKVESCHGTNFFFQDKILEKLPKAKGGKGRNQYHIDCTSLTGQLTIREHTVTGTTFGKKKRGGRGPCHLPNSNRRQKTRENTIGNKERSLSRALPFWSVQRAGAGELPGTLCPARRIRSGKSKKQQLKPRGERIAPQGKNPKKRKCVAGQAAHL